MLRELVSKHYIGMHSGFRFRGEEPSRIEALSDSCFALAIGLLVISSKSPDTFDELVNFTRDLIPFALCITAIVWVWYQHFIYFIRYGFRNPFIVGLNAMLLLILLFYVYPLKFLAKFLTVIYGSMLANLLGIDISGQGASISIQGGDMPSLMIIYNAGVAGIFIILTFMYRYALKKREELKLNDLEIFETKISIYNNALMAGIPLFSTLLVLLIPHPIVAGIIGGITHILYWPVMSFYGKRAGKKRKQLIEQLSSIGFSSPRAS